MERDEILSAHVFCVLDHYGMVEMPRCYVAVRWTMQAIYAFEPDRSGARHVWSKQMDRYRKLRNMSNTACFIASMRTDESLRMVEFFKTLINVDDGNDEAGGSDDSTDLRTFGPLPAYFSCANQSFTGKVLDPIPIKGKGAPSKKRHMAFHEKFGFMDQGI